MMLASMGEIEWITLAGVIGSFITLLVVWFQLRKMAEANKSTADSNKRLADANELGSDANRLSNAMAVLSLEQAISNAGGALEDAAAAILKSEEENKPITESQKRVLAHRLEQWLNFVDRLCSYIRTGLIDEETYRKDYRQMIAQDVISEYPEQFNADTRYHNIVYVHKAWSEDKSAADRAPSKKK